MIRAIVFDFDGTILDTETADFECWCDIFREHGCELELEQWSACVGTTYEAFDPRAYLEQKTGRDLDWESPTADHRRRHDSRVNTLQLPAAIEALLADARRIGIKIGIASSGSREWVEGHIGRLGILDQFDTIRCADDVTLVKPDPELYLTVLRDLNVCASEAVAIEDSFNGARAAKSAGMACVWVPNPITRGMQVPCDLKLSSLEELTLERVLAIRP